MTTQVNPDVIEFLGIVVLYSEGAGLIGYWIFFIFGVCCYLEYAGFRIRFWSLFMPILLYFIQPDEVGGDIHLSLATIAAWTWILINMIHKPWQTAVSFEAGRRISKKMFKD